MKHLIVPVLAAALALPALAVPIAPAAGQRQAADGKVTSTPCAKPAKAQRKKIQREQHDNQKTPKAS